MMTATNSSLSALALIAELDRSGVRLSAERGLVIARPKGATPPALGAQIIRYKPELLKVLNWDADMNYRLLRQTLARAEALTAELSLNPLKRVADLIAHYSFVIEAGFSRFDLDSLHYALLDLERNVHDIVTCRGYDNKIAPAPCLVCNGTCRWCDTPGVLRCGECFSEPKKHKSHRTLNLSLGCNVRA